MRAVRLVLSKHSSLGRCAQCSGLHNRRHRSMVYKRSWPAHARRSVGRSCGGVGFVGSSLGVIVECFLPSPAAECGLTPRSSADPQRRAAWPAKRLWLILHFAGQASHRRGPLSSNYKGFPICQAREIHRAAQRLDSFQDFAFQPDCFAALMHIASSLRDKVRTDKLQPVIDAALNAADPDERRAPGPHSLAAVGRCRRLELSRHTQRRSNLAHQRLAHHAVEESVFFVSDDRRLATPAT